MTVPPSLMTDEMAALWSSVRDRLERNGDDSRGRVAIPAMSADGRLALESLVGRQLRSQVGLDALEQGLARVGVAATLSDALTRLGHPPVGAIAARRLARARATETRDHARGLAARWPEPWAREWIDGVIRAGIFAGLSPDEGASLVASARAVLDALAEATAAPSSRVELAATLLGSAHALDTGTRLERAVTRALTAAESDDDGGRGVWERAGAHLDLVSGAALTWNLPLVNDHPLASAVRVSTDLGLPFVVTQMALRQVAVQVSPGHPVLVVENPRVLEHAAQRGSATSVVCANGNPSTTVRQLVRQLVECGAVVRYHGDFDAAGLAMCARMLQAGAAPWRMTAKDYLAALADADAAGVGLPLDPHLSPPTPWDPELGEVFNTERRIVHEERLLSLLL